MPSKTTFLVFVALVVSSAGAWAAGVSEDPTTGARRQSNGFVIIDHGYFHLQWSGSTDFIDIPAAELAAYNQKISRAFENVPYWIIDYTFFKNRAQRYSSTYEVNMWDFTIADFSRFLDNLLADRGCQAVGKELKALVSQQDDITPNNFKKLYGVAKEKLIQACANVR